MEQSHFTTLKTEEKTNDHIVCVCALRGMEITWGAQLFGQNTFAAFVSAEPSLKSEHCKGELDGPSGF